MPARLAAAVLAALLVTACRSGRHDDAAPAPAAVDSSTRPPAGGNQRIPLETDDRFDAKIAENLARVADPAIVFPEDAGSGTNLDNVAFRDRVVAFVREVSSGAEKVTCGLPLPSKRPFRTVVWIYKEGAQAGRGEASDARLCVALKDATRRAVAAAGGEREAVAKARFLVDLPDHSYSLVELQGKGVELVQGLTPVRVVDKTLVQKRIDEGKGYLLRVIDRERKGVHKYYHANTDKFEDEIHTIYTASTALTLLKLYAKAPDEALLGHIKGAADFMLSMQHREAGDRNRGGFFYSYDLTRKQNDRKLVVGTASKSIFTLLELYPVTKDKKHMEAALLAADWLVSMQQPDGSVRPYVRQEGDRWVGGKKDSTLYTGQVLSALSRMYRVTHNPKYLDAAAQTAGYLAEKVASRGCWLGDEYRKPNPISSSWAVLSLLDFVKATGDARMESTVFRCADELLKRQQRKPEDIYRYGRWQGSLSSSGNGWLAEVMSELYLHCREKGMEGCKRFEDAVVAAIRLLLQYTYSPENAFVAKNPEAAAGGVFWSVRDRYVRTDSVCHGMNAYLNTIGQLGDGPLLELPERPLADRLALAAEAPLTASAAPRLAPNATEAEEEREEDPAEEAVEKDGPATKR